jgi:hypothetical protein
MHRTTAVGDPFALMVAPEAVFAAIERSERLARLKSTICRPLDNPRPEKPSIGAKSFDAEIELMGDTDTPDSAAESCR